MTRKALIILLLICWMPSVLFTGDQEYLFKSVLLGKFPRYITWPESSGMNDTSKPFVFVVIGKTPLSAALEEVYSNSTKERKINKKKVKIITVTSPEEIKECHILFISKTEENNLSKIISMIKDRPVLIVGDTKGFAQKGVHINFYLIEEGKKLRFEINESAIRESSLRFHYSLLRVAKIINPRERRR